jgi:hypothetical protein
MEWTSPADLTEQVLRLWDSGRLLACRIEGTVPFPFSLRLRRPDAKALGERFGDVQQWIGRLKEGSRETRGFGYEIAWDEIGHRQVGRNRVPRGVTIPTESDALQLIGKEREARRFQELVSTTVTTFPGLVPWLARKPLLALQNAGDWNRILAVLAWFRDHHRADIYLRQADIPGVDTKFIETRKGLLMELLDLVLPLQGYDPQFSGAQAFERRYGLRTKPSLIRFRLLDERLAIQGLGDLAVPVAQFAGLATSAKRIFITENEVNGLSFPDAEHGLVVFGLGYGIEVLSSVEWLREREIFYWGDIDTHGFAMLDRLRANFPHARSLLMDRETLLSHRRSWGREERPFLGSLSRLTGDERALFDDLQQNRLGERLRLEQEQIGFGWVRHELRSLISA